MAEPEDIDLKSTAAIAEMMLGFLISEPLKLGESFIRDEFRGPMSELYESLDACLDNCAQSYGKHTWEDSRADLLNTVDKLMGMCIQKGFETGCRVGGFSLEGFVTSEDEEKLVELKIAASHRSSQ